MNKPLYRLTRDYAGVQVKRGNSKKVYVLTVRRRNPSF